MFHLFKDDTSPPTDGMIMSEHDLWTRDQETVVSCESWEVQQSACTWYLTLIGDNVCTVTGDFVDTGDAGGDGVDKHEDFGKNIRNFE